MSKGEVLEKLSKLQSDSHTGTLVEPCKLTMHQFLTDWLETIAKPKVRYSTYLNYSRAIRLHLSPRIGGVRLQKLTRQQVQGVYAGMVADGRGPHAVRLVHATLRTALRWAVRVRLISFDPTEVIDAPKIPDSDVEILDPRQLAQLLASVEGDAVLEPLLHLAIGSGARLGECLGLRWDAVDLGAGRVSIRYSLSETRGHWNLGDVKTKAGRRMIDLPRHALDALERHRKAQFARGLMGAGYLFTTNGQPLRRNRLHGRYKMALKRAQLPNVSFHALRHSHATACLMAGENVRTLSARLGHSTVAITLNCYSHVLPEMASGTATRLDGVMNAAMASIGYTLATRTA